MDKRETTASAAAQLVHAAMAMTPGACSGDTLAHARRCLLDYLSCAFEALPLPWSEQAWALAEPADGAHGVGRPGMRSLAGAAFANAVAGHGLVREDMHAGSVAHLGVVVWPTVLALAERHRVSGREAMAAAIVGYEVGARIGRAVITPSLSRLFRPTGLVGPYAAVAAGARVAGLDERQALQAFALAGNCSAGLNQWAHTGGSEMYFHPGFAVRNALACLDLARLGAQASDSILEGEAGFFQAYARAPLATPLCLFEGGRAEIAQVFNKPVPACNFAQTPCQAALLALRSAGAGRRIVSVQVATTHAAVTYPGCDARGPFRHALQAKMSILFGVAAVLARGEIAEANYRVLDDPEIGRLVAATTLVQDAAYTRAFPARQGARVTLALDDGTQAVGALDDVVAADMALIRARFRQAAQAVVGGERAARIERMVDAYESEPDAAALPRLCAAAASPTATRREP